MSERFKERLLADVATTDAAAIDLAENSLARSIVSVSIDDCRYPFVSELPPELRSAFDFLGSPTKNVSSLSLRLRYDQPLMMFKPDEVNLRLDNGFQIHFYRTPIIDKRSADSTQTSPILFIPTLLTPEGNSAVKSGQTPLVQESVVNEILKEIGVDIPTEPNRASWSAIEDILSFSRQWKASSEYSNVIDAQNSLRVTSDVTGVGMAINVDYGSLESGQPLYLENELDSLDDPESLGKFLKRSSVREVIVDLEQSSEPFRPANTSLRYTMQADGDEKPHFSKISRVDISYAGQSISDFGEPFEILGSPLSRLEDYDKGEILPTPKLLRYIRKQIGLARNSLPDQDTA